jgi:2-oxoisovalerate dehydrogenase E2 component (dihydrolipoyl transacylase)
MGRYVFRLPDVGEGTAEAEIAGWHVAVGDTVAEDQPLVDVTTDKATVEISSPVAGKVLSLNGTPGEMLAVGSELIVFEVEGEGNVAAALAEAAATPARAQSAAAPAPTTRAEPAAARKAAAEPKREAAAEIATPAAAGTGRYVFRLPDVGEGTAEAEIAGWHVAVGDTVAEDQPLVDVTTDKATVEISSPVAGKVLSINGTPGEMLAVGSELIVFEVEGEGNATAPAPPPRKAATESKREPAVAAAAAPAPTKPASSPLRPRAAALPAKANGAARAPVAAPFTTRPIGEKPMASPAVRNRARELGIELQFVPGTGPAGRITHEDLDAFIASGGRGGAAGGLVSISARRAERHGVDEVKVIGIRRKIAERMQESKRRIPHYSYVEEVDVTALEELRQHLNERRAEHQPKLTLLPFLMLALVRAVPEHPAVNARFDDDAGIVHRHEAVHIGIATQTPNGLLVPVVRHAEARDIWDCAAEVQRLAAAARDGKTTRDELSGSTITITSLGAIGGVVTTPVINYPEVAIVGVNKIVERPMIRDGQIAVRKMMNLSSSFDHRVVDGWDAAVFVQHLKGLLEQPATLFMD